MSTHDDLRILGFKDLSYLMHPGIYVMVLRGEVVHVGRTVDIFHRLSQKDSKDRTYDKVYFVRCANNELDRIEALIIHKFKPKDGGTWNFNKNTDPRNKEMPGEVGTASVTLNIGGQMMTLPIRGKPYQGWRRRI